VSWWRTEGSRGGTGGGAKGAMSGPAEQNLRWSDGAVAAGNCGSVADLAAGVEGQMATRSLQTQTRPYLELLATGDARLARRRQSAGTAGN
jgi:hypothetical protein